MDPAYSLDDPYQVVGNVHALLIVMGGGPDNKE